MSLYMSIIHGKEHRNKNYLISNKWYSPSCRNHGNCEWCQGNRLYNQKKKIEKAEYSERWEENGE